MILALGVIDIPYVQARSRRSQKTRAGTVTTGDVAEWLERRYHIMEIFVEERMADVASDLEDSVRGALESYMMGAPASLDPFGVATSKIEDRLKQWIAQAEMDYLGFPGIPTQAAKDRASGKRRSARFRTARATGAKPVSFIDTGLYFSSLKAWME